MIRTITRWLDKRAEPEDPRARVAFYAFRDLGFSRKSARLRADALALMEEAERLGIDPIAELAKTLPRINIPELPSIRTPWSEQ